MAEPYPPLPHYSCPPFHRSERKQKLLNGALARLHQGNKELQDLFCLFPVLFQKSIWLDLTQWLCWFSNKLIHRLPERWGSLAAREIRTHLTSLTRSICVCLQMCTVSLFMLRPVVLWKVLLAELRKDTRMKKIIYMCVHKHTHLLNMFTCNLLNICLLFPLIYS